MRLTELWIFQILQKCRGMLNVKFLFYNVCLTHYFSEFKWTPGMTEKLILGFQKRWKQRFWVFCFKNFLGEHATRQTQVPRALRRQKKNRVWCSQKQVRYFKNLGCVAGGIVWFHD